MKITEIFKQSNNKLITFDELYETVECLKKAMAANTVIGALPQLATFDPLASFSHKFPNDFMTLGEIMKVKCCFDDFLEPYLPVIEPEIPFEEPESPILVDLDGCPENPLNISPPFFTLDFQLTLVQAGPGELTGTWVSSNESLATVDQTGFVTTIELGEVTVSFIPDQPTTGNLDCTITLV